MKKRLLFLINCNQITEINIASKWWTKKYYYLILFTYLFTNYISHLSFSYVSEVVFVVYFLEASVREFLNVMAVWLNLLELSKR